MKDSVSIYMCCHKQYSIVPPLTIPIQGGAYQNTPISGCLPDIGKNGDISARNKEYCELTVQYYVWKNESAKAYGFCHYRRFFCFNQKVKKKYLVRKRLSIREQKKYLGTPAMIEQIMNRYDIVVPYPENMGISAMDYYCTSAHHYKEDMDLFLRIIKERFPLLSHSVDIYVAESAVFL